MGNTQTSNEEKKIEENVNITNDINTSENYDKETENVKEKDTDNLSYINYNIIGRGDIPNCLININNNCRSKYNNIYNLDIIERYLDKLNEIMNILKTDILSKGGLNIISKTRTLFSSTESNFKGDKNKMEISSLNSTIGGIYKFLDSEEKDKVKINIRNNKNKRCEIYCNNNNNCFEKCNNKVNRYDILLSLIEVYKEIKNKLDNQKLKDKINIIINKLIEDIKYLSTIKEQSELKKNFKKIDDIAKYHNYKEEIKDIEMLQNFDIFLNKMKDEITEYNYNYTNCISAINKYPKCEDNVN